MLEKSRYGELYAVLGNGPLGQQSYLRIPLQKHRGNIRRGLPSFQCLALCYPEHLGGRRQLEDGKRPGGG